jgi:hypothetical protein
MTTRRPTPTELIAEGVERAQESGMTMPINWGKVINLHLYERGYKIVPIESGAVGQSLGRE